MAQHEVHTAEVHNPDVHTLPHGRGRVSPIFVPVVKSPAKLIRRGARSRRQLLIAGVGLIVLLIGAFTYAFVVEHNLEQTLRTQTP